MSYTPKPNTGTLWPNQYKKADNHPDVKGDLFISRELLRTLVEHFGMQCEAVGSGAEALALLQQRNVARIRLDYDFIKDDKVASRWDAPDFLDSVKGYLLYRGVYDSYYDFAPGGALYEFNGKKIPTVQAAFTEMLTGVDLGGNAPQV